MLWSEIKMETAIQITKNEIKKISLEFRTMASRLTTTSHDEGISNLKRFIRYIDVNKIISGFVAQHTSVNSMIKI